MNQEKTGHYQRYLQNRFMVKMIYETEMGPCAHIIDKEQDNVLMALHTGDSLADGTIGDISDKGVIFKPPRADVPPFVLKSKQEQSPVGSEKFSKYRHEMNQMLARDEVPMHGDDQVIIMMLEKDSKIS